MFLIKLPLLLLLFLHSFVALSSSYISSNITCKPVDTWLESEKELLTKKLGNENFDELIFLEVNKNYIHKETGNCIYKSDALIVAFHQGNEGGGGDIFIVPVRKVHNGKRLIYSKHSVYMFSDDYTIEKQFSFEINEKTNYFNVASAKFIYSQHLYPKQYAIVAIFTYKDKRKYAYVIKTKPTTRW
ncbi:hypothetical protein BHECKSOX2_1556 [Bathymodiolus heckerae thiotrophic gill symbiont]|uniref:hypothetical protein n=1 Tax=Bathymodiolus heckerae thiotrophic gill symbiont TaxID=1052212 RepID=UPI0010B0260B|nr:hypothetical protein [Bathymodiolus heckerae thiotrophic gill symbiont]CAC9433523.1 hypothetical protein [uncultured Gammaproteobacteria bacterium]SMN14159.1 hypothetical protein BHECKSOX2_1556 [Bathymodiolus heckerae thiotrophic gill symbiont]